MPRVFMLINIAICITIYLRDGEAFRLFQKKMKKTLSGYISFKDGPNDFIVIEDRVLHCLDLSGRVLDKEETSEEVEEKQALLAKQAEEWLQNVLSPSQMLELGEISASNDKDRSTLLRIEPPLSKVERTSAHQYIRSLHANLDSKTEISKIPSEAAAATTIFVYKRGVRSVAAEGGQRDDNVGKERRGGGGGKKGGKRKVVVQRWDTQRPDYLHFSVTKTMMSTSEMIERLSRRMGLLPTRFAFCGSKDKRSTTVQRISLWRVEEELLRKVAEGSKGIADVVISDIESASSPMRLGDLAGNLFVITMRPCDYANPAVGNKALSALQGAVESLGSACFVNYFGPQRFGSPLQINPEVGRLLLQCDYKRAFFALLLSPSSEAELENGIFANKEALMGMLLTECKDEHFIQNVREQWTRHCQAVDSAIGEQSTRALGKGPVEEEEEEESRFDSDFATEKEEGEGEEEALYPSRSKQLSRALEQRLSCISSILQPPHFYRIPSSTPFVQKKLLAELGYELESNAKGDFTKSDFANVFANALPKQLKQLFVNAYQSRVWNDAAEHLRNGRHGVEEDAFVQEGDLVLVDTSFQQITAWQVASQNISLSANHVKEWGAKVETEDPQVLSTDAAVEDERFEDNGADDQVAFWIEEGDERPAFDLASRAFYHIVTAKEAQEKHWSPEAVILPLPGYATRNNAFIDKKLKKDNLGVLMRGDHPDALFRLPGAYRHVLTRARNLQFMHSDGNQEQQSWTQLMSEEQKREDLLSSSSTSFCGKVEQLRLSGRLETLLDKLQEASNNSKGSSRIESQKSTDASLKVMFSLCASSYATTYLDHLASFKPRTIVFRT